MKQDFSVLCYFLNIYFVNFSITVDIENVSTTFYLFQVYNPVIRHLCKLQNNHFDKSSTHLSPYIVITILLTIFPMLYFISLWLFLIPNLYFLIPSTFSSILQTPFPLNNGQNVLYIALTGVAQLVGAFSHTPKGCGFDSQSGHITRLWVQSLVGTRMESNQLIYFFSLSLPPPSHSVSLCLFLSGSMYKLDHTVSVFL